MPELRKGFRKEKDSLGWVSVPRDALYGAQTVRALGNFKISGRTAHPALIRAYLRIKRAAAQTNFHCGVLPKKEKEWMIQAVDRLLGMNEKNWPKLFPIDPYQAGAGTSQNMNINEVVANLANQLKNRPLGSYNPIHPNDQVNLSQSTNDTFPTAMRLALIETSKPLVEELFELSMSLLKKNTQWKTIPKAGRTHLQDAVPMLLGQEFSGYAATFQRCAYWVTDGRDALRELGIGGSAVGTGLNVPKQYPLKIVKELEILSQEPLFLAPNLFELMQSQSQISFFSAMLRTTALELTRFCNDLRLLASGPMTGLNELLLPAVQPGSSIMPGKVNPSIVEMANQTAFSVLGFDQTVSYCIQAGQLELNVMMPMMAYALLEATSVMTNALHTLRTRCIDELNANVPKLTHYFESTSQVATALAPYLGYSRTAEVVQESLSSGMSVIDLVQKRKLIPAHKLKLLLSRII